jgi:hypothetical protein
MVTQINPNQLNLEEQIARIAQMIDESDKARIAAAKARIEEELFPRGIIYQAMVAGAGLLTAGAALASVFFIAIR